MTGELISYTKRAARKARTWARGGADRLGRQLRARGVLPASRDYQPFMILSTGRTGSNMLVGLLQSHPLVECYREVFHFHKPSWGYPHLRYRNTDALQRLRAEDPKAFLERAVLGPHPPRRAAVGFKVLYWHAEEDREPWRAGVVPALLSIEGLKVIHLVRRDKLAIVASGVAAEQDGVWVLDKGVPKPASPSLHLDPELLERRVRRIREMEQKYARVFGSLEMLQVDYEDLVADPEGQMGEVGDFLGLPPFPYAYRTKKQARGSVASRIENYEELKRQFEGTEMEELFS